MATWRNWAWKVAFAGAVARLPHAYNPRMSDVSASHENLKISSRDKADRCASSLKPLPALTKSGRDRTGPRVYERPKDRR